MVEKKTIGHRFTNGLIVGLLTLVAATCLYPILYNLAVSLSSKAAAEAGMVVLWPVDFTFNAYLEVMDDKRFWNSFMISVERVFLALLIKIPVLTMAAYALGKTKNEFAARNKIMWLCMFCMLFGGGQIPWYMVMIKYGMNNSVLGLALCGGLPIYDMILMLNFFQGIPKELEEAAMVDGAGPWCILLRIVVPLSKPIFATIALFTIVGHWNEFFNGLVLSTNQDSYPLQTYIKQMVIKLDSDAMANMTTEELQSLALMSNKTLNAAKLFISMIPVLCIYPFLQKYFVTGMTLGGVKE